MQPHTRLLSITVASSVMLFGISAIAADVSKEGAGRSVSG
jgi:hypothetical protein